MDELKIAYSELSSILVNAPEEYKSRIPQKLLGRIEEEKDVDYDPGEIDLSDPSKDYKLHETTKQLLAVIYYNYWTKTEEDKKELMDRFVENDKIREEKYSVDKMFSSEEINSAEVKEEPEKIEVVIPEGVEVSNLKVDEDKSMVETENKGLFKKIIDFFKGLFNNKKEQ